MEDLMSKYVIEYHKLMKVLGKKQTYLDLKLLTKKRIGMPPRNVILFDIEYLPHFADFPPLIDIGDFKVKFCNLDFVASHFNFLVRHKYSSKFSLEEEEAIKMAKGSIRDEKKLETAINKIKQAAVEKREIWASSYKAYYLYNYVNLYSSGKTKQVHLLSPQEEKKYINIIFIYEYAVRSPDLYMKSITRKDKEILSRIRKSELLSEPVKFTIDKVSPKPKGYQLYIGKWKNH